MKKFFFSIILIFTCLICFSQTKVSNLLCENLNDPIGLDIEVPQFTWQLSSDIRNVMQTDYEIRVGSICPN